MADTTPGRAHLIAGGFPSGAMSGHDHDYARLRLLGLLAERDIPASVANDFADVAKWLPLSQLLITYVAGPYPDAAQTSAIREWLAAGGHWLALHGTSGGRAERVEGSRSRRTVKSEHHALLGSYFLTHPPLGHCHNPAIRAARAPDPADKTPPVFHGAWETGAFNTLLRNAIAWGVAV